MDLLLFFIVSTFTGCLGYDRILNFDDGDCDTYKFHYMTQYQSYLINWSGKPFSHTCMESFRGYNEDNVDTNYRVCFETLDYHFDGCGTNIQFSSGFNDNYRVKYDCNTPIPSTWCSDADNFAYAKIVITSKSKTNSSLKLEVTVTADTSLSIGAAVGISLGCVVVIGISTTVFIVLFCRRLQAKPSSGRVFKTRQDLQNTPVQSQQVARHSTEQIEMVPSRGGIYHQPEVTGQQTAIVPAIAQTDNMYPSLTPSTLPTNPINSSYDHYLQQHAAVSPSAPPTSYDEKM